MSFVPIVFRSLRPVFLALSLSALGCHGQSVPVSGGRLSPELARRVEVLIRSRSSLPPNYVLELGAKSKSEVPGFEQIEVSFTVDGKTSKPVPFLISSDGKTLAQFSKYDLSPDPTHTVSDAGRPARGGPESAPVTIVGFDDLECPFCAKMHAAMFPALQARYKDQVRFVYKDFPLVQIHPWANRAAIDVNCLGAQSTPGYWNAVDHIHAHAGELGGAEKSLDVANNALDTITRDEGKVQKVDEAKLNACLAKQDDSAIKAMLAEGEALGVNSTPVLFVNGEKFEGTYPITDLYRMIDGALTAQGRTPPPLPAETAAGQTASKPGS